MSGSPLEALVKEVTLTHCLVGNIKRILFLGTSFCKGGGKDEQGVYACRPMRAGKQQVRKGAGRHWRQDPAAWSRAWRSHQVRHLSSQNYVLDTSGLARHAVFWQVESVRHSKNWVGNRYICIR